MTEKEILQPKVSSVTHVPEAREWTPYLAAFGVLVALTGDASDDLVRNLGMHIAAARPVALSRSQVPPEVVAKEREIAIEQAKATGKPQQIAEKIAEGKLNAFFKEQTLLDQDFFNAQKFKGSITEFLKKSGVTLEKYIRVEVGQA